MNSGKTSTVDSRIIISLIYFGLLRIYLLSLIWRSDAISPVSTEIGTTQAGYVTLDIESFDRGVKLVFRR